MGLRRYSYANVMSTLAVVLALGGTAVAATTIDGANIKDHTVKGRKLVNNTLTGTQVKESTLGAVPTATNATKLGGTAATGFVKGNVRVVRAAASLDAGTQGTFTPLLTIPGLGTVSGECYTSGDAFGEKFTNTSGTTAYVAVLLSNEDDSANWGKSGAAQLGNNVADTREFASGNSGGSSGFSQRLTVVTAGGTHSAEILIGGVTEANTASICDVSVVAIYS
jgi:hypothetical protein